MPVLPPNIDVAGIVQEVLRRLEGMGRGDANSAGGSNGSEQANKTSAPTDKTQLRCSDAVVSVQALFGRLDGVQQILVGDRAIITPAAKDEFRERGIAVVRGSSSCAASPAKSLLIASDAGDWPLSEQIQSVQDDDGWASFFTEAAQQARPALILTDSPHRIACLANRNPSICAAAVEELGSLERILDELSANVVCIRALAARQTSFGLLCDRVTRATRLLSTTQGAPT